MPELSLPWPDTGADLAALVRLNPIPTAEALAVVARCPNRTPPGDVTRLSSQLALFSARPGAVSQAISPEFAKRFRALSTIEALDGEKDDIARSRRATKWIAERLLRIYGYYRAKWTQTVAGSIPKLHGSAGDATVRFDIAPGPRFRFGKVELPTLEAAGTDYPLLRGHSGSGGRPLYSDRIVTAQGELDLALAENGYPFARLANRTCWSITAARKAT